MAQNTGRFQCRYAIIAMDVVQGYPARTATVGLRKFLRIDLSSFGLHAAFSDCFHERRLYESQFRQRVM
jgi:hypothetical protein